MVTKFLPVIRLQIACNLQQSSFAVAMRQVAIRASFLQYLPLFQSVQETWAAVEPTKSCHKVHSSADRQIVIHAYILRHVQQLKCKWSYGLQTFGLLSKQHSSPTLFCHQTFSFFDIVMLFDAYFDPNMDLRPWFILKVGGTSKLC